MKKFILLPIMMLLALSACGGGEKAPSDLNITEGKRIFMANCAACHAVEPDLVVVGPALAGIANWGGDVLPGLDAYAYIEQSIIDPEAYLTAGFKPLMPTSFGQTLSEQDLEALMAYMMTLD